MYIETRFYVDGTVEARLTNCRPVQDPDDNTGRYDFYVDEIKSLDEWIETELEVYAPDDHLTLMFDFEDGKWVDISNYC